MWRERIAAGAAVCVLGWVVALAPAGAQTFDAVADTFVDSDMSGANFGNLDFAEVGLQGPPKDTIDRALLAFDLSSLPPSAPIGNARLRLFISDTSGDPLGLGVTVASLASTFDENTVTWNTQPAVLPAPTAMRTMNSAPGEVFEIDVTALVRAQRMGGNPTQILLRIAATNESLPGLFDAVFFDFSTKESTTGQPAQLVISAVTAAPLLSGRMLLVALLLIAAVGVSAVRRHQRLGS